MNEYLFWIILAGLSALILSSVFKVVFFPLKMFRKAIVIILPISALILYSVYGLPDFDNLPTQIKANLITQAAVSKIEKRLEKHISLDSEIDIILLINYYKKLQNYPKLRLWSERLYALNSQDDHLYANLLEAKILENAGVISESLGLEIEKKFIDKQYSEPLIPYYLSLYHIQNDKYDDALSVLQELIQKSYAHDPWIKDSVEIIKFIADRKGVKSHDLIPKPLMPK